MENENVKIEYVENGVSKDGYQKFIYNFILDGKNVNHLFKGFGRITKKGISSYCTPVAVEQLLGKFYFWHDMEIGRNLYKAQKKIDRCNYKKGCRYYCHTSQQADCSKLQAQNKLIEDLTKVQSFRGYKF